MTKEIIKFISHSLLMTSALISCSFLVFSYSKNEENREKSMRKILILFFGLNMLFVSFLLFRETGFIQLNSKEYPITIIHYLLSQVLFFHFVFILTNKEKKIRIHSFHYILLGILFIFVTSFFYIIYHKIDARDELDSYLLPLTLFYFLIYQITYNTWSLKYIYSYKKEIIQRNILSDKKINLNWLVLVITIDFVITLAGISMFYFGQNNYYLLVVLANTLASLTYGIILFNILKKNYSFFTENNKVLSSNGHIFYESGLTETIQSVQENIIISQKELENYFKEQKPYLNPMLKIEDIADFFHTNRVYTSKFINETYGMNFNQYINSWRINEVKELEKIEANKTKSTTELSQLAGFGSVRSYWRAVKTNNEMN